MWPDAPLIDVHCHRPTDGPLQIFSLDTHECVIADEVVSTLLCRSNGGAGSDRLAAEAYFSLGIHPWFIGWQEIESSMQMLDAACNDPKLLAIGECGLDKCIGTPFNQQIEVFIRQIELAERFGKPLVIHCVKAYNELMQIKKSRRTDSVWIVHGFAGKPELAGQLLRCGCYLSLGGALLNPRSPAGRSLTEMPLDRLFLETDTSDLPIGEIYATAAKILEIGEQTLRRQILNNFKRVFLQ